MNILLTGGSRGLGKVIAESLLCRGDSIWIIATNPKSHEGWPKDLADRVNWVYADLGDPEKLKDTLATSLDPTRLSFDGLVNNAAIAYDDLVTNLNVPDLERSFRVNVFAPMELSRFAIRNMLLHRKSGALVHISSICSRTGYKGLAMYAATKGAIESFSRGLAREWGSKGIRSNCVLPGFMETDMSSTLSQEQRDKIYRRSSLGCPTDPKSVAETVCYLLSDASRSVTGQDFIVDSGSM
ncbi:MAG: SDR family NAD(P)-dependent oxidoreductase [Pirellula sp.]